MTLKKFYKDFQQIRSKEKLLILSLLFFCFLLGFAGAIFLGKAAFTVSISSNSPILPSPIPVPADVSLSTPNQKVGSGGSFDVTINLSSPSVGVEAADFIIYFDPQILKAINIQDGNYFKNYPVKKIAQNYVKISSVASFGNNKIIIPKGKGIIASVRFTALKPADTLIYFDPDKTIIASNGKNIVGKMSSLNLSIK